MRVFYLLLTTLFFINTSLAQDGDLSALLSDINGDGEVRLLFFGDSITFGVGDGTSVGEFIEEPPITDGGDGYPRRVEELMGILADNEGAPGEFLTEGGIDRFPAVVASSVADVVGFFEGSNDAVHKVSGGAFELAVQRAINVAGALGKQIILFTIPPPCCDKESLSLFTGDYTSHIKELAVVNSLPVVDIERAWQTTCNNISTCHLYNLPEGLHPNIEGYDVIAQVIVATLLGIDIFSEEGAVELEEALELPEGTVIVKPELE